MPLTRVIDYRKERENINKFWDFEVPCRKWASLEIQPRAVSSVLLCFGGHPHPVTELPATRPWARKSVVPSYFWPEVQMEEKKMDRG